LFFTSFHIFHWESPVTSSFTTFSLADRVNEDCTATYNPFYSLAETVEAVRQTHYFNQVQQIHPAEAIGAGDGNAPEDLQQVTKMESFKELADTG
jgi:hypothetical protein